MLAGHNAEVSSDLWNVAGLRSSCFPSSVLSPSPPHHCKWQFAKRTLHPGKNRRQQHPQNHKKNLYHILILSLISLKPDSNTRSRELDTKITCQSGFSHCNCFIMLKSYLVVLWEEHVEVLNRALQHRVSLSLWRMPYRTILGSKQPLSI